MHIFLAMEGVRGRVLGVGFKGSVAFSPSPSHPGGSTPRHLHSRANYTGFEWGLGGKASLLFIPESEQAS